MKAASATCLEADVGPTTTSLQATAAANSHATMMVGSQAAVAAARSKAKASVWCVLVAGWLASAVRWQVGTNEGGHVRVGNERGGDMT